MFKRNKIKKLEAELDANFEAVFRHVTSVENNLSALSEVHNGLADDYDEFREDILQKVDAIINYLGIEIEYVPEETKPAEVVAKKKKAVKKKGRR